MTKPDTRTCRGYLIHRTATYIEKAYEPARRKQIYERMPANVRELLAFVNEFDWYPIEDAAAIFRAIAAHHQATDGDVAAALEAVGREVAESEMSTSLKFLFRMMTPSLFVRKAAELWERNSRCGELEVGAFDASKRALSVELKGASGFDYVGLVAPGFVLYALEAVGCKNPRATYSFDEASPSPDSIAYELTWD